MREQMGLLLMGKWLLLIAGILCLASCVTTQSKLSTSRSEFGTAEVSRGSFWHCSGHGCRFRKKVGLSDSEWSKITQHFEDLGPGRSGAQERIGIQQAIAEFELIVGKKTGTSPDVGGSFQGFGKSGQLDCVDEMLNVASYLDLMIQEGLVIKHRLGERYTNQLFQTGPWPHTSTSIVELETGVEYIVDSWLLKNGSLPFVVTLGEWSDGGWQHDLLPEVKEAMELREVR